jgi:hypothetical protein
MTRRTVGFCVLALLLIPGVATSVPWGSCATCGIFTGDNCSYYYGSVQTGSYYTVQSEVHQKNGAKDCIEKNCKVTLSTQSTKKYNLDAGADYKWFSLKAGFADEEVTAQGCEASAKIDRPNQSCDEWAYYKYDYVQYYYARYNNTKSFYCLPCSDVKIYTLRTYSNPVCDDTDRTAPNNYSPALYTVDQLCKDWGAP